VKDLLSRTLTGILLVALVPGTILLGPWPLIVVVLALYVLGAFELNAMLSKEGHKPCGLLMVSGGLFIGFTFLGLHLQLHPLWLLIPMAAWAAGTLRIRVLLPAFLYLFWLSLPLAAFVALGWVDTEPGYSPLIPLSAIILVWINDIFAYLTGSLLGRHQMTPELSPGKTWEGFTGGILFNMLAGWVLFRITGTLSAPIWIASGGLISLVAVAGDLFESGLKRKFGIKDTGKLLPGHGGILDRFDSLLFVSPVLLILLLLANLLG